MPLFEVAVLSKPSEEAKKNGAVQELLLGPLAVVAQDKLGAVMQASRGREDIDAGQVEILVRPFVG